MATGVGLKPIDYPWNSAFRNTEVFEIESKAAGVTYVVFVATKLESLRGIAPAARDQGRSLGRHLHMTVCDKEITEPTLYQLLAVEWMFCARAFPRSAPHLKRPPHDDQRSGI
jgi:hypothetical protein